MNKQQMQRRIDQLEESLSDAADAIDQVVVWMNGYAIPAIDPERCGECDGGNSLAAGLEMKAEEIRDLLTGQ